LINWIRKAFAPQVVAIPVPIHVQVPVYVQPLRCVITQNADDGDGAGYTLRLSSSLHPDSDGLVFGSDDPEQLISTAALLKNTGGVEYSFEGFTQGEE